jgi:ubiquinone/menaquinone biosynthesis C-methylase UbiE
MNTPVRFDNSAAYERYMGLWSQLAGEAFLQWLLPGQNLAWLDVGCGSGAFSELIASRAAPRSIAGIDPAAPMLDYARGRPSLKDADLRLGDAMALPWPENSFDIAVMPLVLFFVPEPARGVAEMARVVRPGGWVAAYSWDMDGGGFPYESLHEELRAMGVTVPMAPSPEASRPAEGRALWRGAGLTDVDTHKISVRRLYADFNDWWATVLGAPSAGALIAGLSAHDTAHLQQRMRARLTVDTQGRLTCSAHAIAVKGRVPEHR